MSKLTDLLKTEPAMMLGTINALLAALVVPDLWAKAVMAVAALLLSLVTRSRVSPV